MALRQLENITPGPTNAMGVKSMSGPDSSGNPLRRENQKAPQVLPLEGGGRSLSCRLTLRMWSTRWRTSERCLFMHTVLDSKDGRCFNCSGKGHSRRDCPAGKRTELRGAQGGSEDQGWSKPLESAQDLKRGRMILEKKEVLLFFRPTLARSFIKPERQLHFANSPN